ESSRPMGVISSDDVKARTWIIIERAATGNVNALCLTSTSTDIALCTLMVAGGSKARDKTSSMEVPILIFMILMRSARSDKLSRIISGKGFSTICGEFSFQIQERFRECLPVCHGEL